MRLALIIAVLAAIPAGAAGPTGEDLLRKAIVTNNVQTIEDLLSIGVDPNARDNQGETALSFAVMWGARPTTYDVLLKWHADPSAVLDSRNRSEFPDTPLHFAARGSNLQLATKLLQAGAQVDAKGPGGRTALHTAVGLNRLDMFHLLIEKGASVNTRDAEGASPLDDAVWNGSLDMTALLIAHGAPVNEPDAGTGATPISEAAFRGFTPLVRYLLQLHPDLQTVDKKGYTALDNAVRMGKEDCALMLLEAQPAGDLTPAFFTKSMEAAIAKDESQFIAGILQRGTSLSTPLPSGSTPLDAAAFSGSLKTVRTLLDNGADPNSIGPNGSTPLEDAALKGFDAIVTALLDHGAQINQKDTASGSTPLYAAASFGRASAVKALLDHGADPALCGNNHKTPYQVAIDNHFPQAAALLESTKACRP